MKEVEKSTDPNIISTIDSNIDRAASSGQLKTGVTSQALKEQARSAISAAKQAGKFDSDSQKEWAESAISRHSTTALDPSHANKINSMRTKTFNKTDKELKVKKSREEMEEYLFEFLEKSKIEMQDYLDKAKVHDIKTKEMIRDTKDTDPDSKSAPKGKLSIVKPKKEKEADKPDFVRPRGALSKSDLYDVLMKEGQTQSAIMLRNWGELDNIAQEYLDKSDGLKVHLPKQTQKDIIDNHDTASEEAMKIPEKAAIKEMQAEDDEQ